MNLKRIGVQSGIGAVGGAIGGLIGSYIIPLLDLHPSNSQILLLVIVATALGAVLAPALNRT